MIVSTKGNKPRYMTKKPIKVNYHWHSLIGMTGDYEPRQWSEADLKPRFLGKKSMAIEDWSLERIRQKYFIELKGAKAYQLERWMPKVFSFLSVIMKREIISLREVALFFGMPGHFLVSLAKRDPNFRRLVIHWRLKNLDQKADRVRGAVLAGEMSYLEKIHPRSTALRMDVSTKPNYEGCLDVGWRPRQYKRAPEFRGKKGVEDRGFQSVL